MQTTDQVAGEAREKLNEVVDLIVKAMPFVETNFGTPLRCLMNATPRELAEQIAAALRAQPERGAEEKELPRIEFHQQDFIPGFAAFLPDATTPAPESKAFCVLNIGSMLSTVYHGDTKREDLPYFLADSIMHEVIHVLEQWAGVEFSEDRVDALIEKYRTALEAPHAGGPGGLDDGR